MKHAKSTAPVSALDWALNQITNEDARREVEAHLQSGIDRADKAESKLGEATAALAQVARDLGIVTFPSYSPEEDDS